MFSLLLSTNNVAVIMNATLETVLVSLPEIALVLFKNLLVPPVLTLREKEDQNRRLVFANRSTTSSRIIRTNRAENQKGMASGVGRDYLLNSLMAFPSLNPLYLKAKV